MNFVHDHQLGDKDGASKSREDDDMMLFHKVAHLVGPHLFSRNEQLKNGARESSVTLSSVEENMELGVETQSGLKKTEETNSALFFPMSNNPFVSTGRLRFFQRSIKSLEERNRTYTPDEDLVRFFTDVEDTDPYASAFASEVDCLIPNAMGGINRSEKQELLDRLFKKVVSY